MAHPIADAFAWVAKLLTDEPRRRGNSLAFKSGEEIVYAGDIHGHRANLAKIISYANLPANPKRQLVLQEIIHGGPPDPQGGDRSVEVLLRAARLKLSCPQQVHFLMGNHDLAQVAGIEIAKDGAGVCKAFDLGLDHAFGADAAEVRTAIAQFIRALPLVGRCDNGMLLSHSLPNPNRLSTIDWTIFDRPYVEADFKRGAGIYEWTWGRNYTEELMAAVGEKLGCRQFALGHLHLDSGYQVMHERAVILASDGPHGAIMVFDAGQAVANEALESLVRPIVML